MNRPLILVACHVTAVALALGLSPCRASAQCGDDQIGDAEQCDDGNRFRWDGCDLECRYEQVQRVTSLEVSQYAAPSPCTPQANALGQSFSSLGRQGLNSALASAIADGRLDALMPLLLLDDPLGVDDAAIEVGSLSAQSDPQVPGSGLDSWHLGEASQLDGGDLPVRRLPGSIVSGDLSAGPGVIELPTLGGQLRVLESRIMARVDPPLSLPAPPPDLLAAGFLTFEGLDGSSSARGLCGNVTVESLSLVPATEDLTAGGQSPCSASCPQSRGYTYCGDGMPVGPGCNSLLDVLVSGCSTFVGICIPLVSPTQPDVGVGGSPPHALVADPVSGKVTVVVPDDAYSSFFQFSSQRVHMTNNLSGIFADSFESEDLSGWSSALP
jgi:cysteine-rich repeat protein